MSLKEAILHQVYRFWAATLRIQEAGPGKGQDPVFYVFWHAVQFPLLWRYRHRQIGVLVSRHRDGERAARLARKLGFFTARGSSTRGGVAGARALIRWAHRGHSVAVAPDGPQGPARQVKEGFDHLIRLVGHPVVPVGVAMTPHWKAGSWDRFQIPYPFARVVIYLGAPMHRCPSPRELEKHLHVCEQKARAMLNVPLQTKEGAHV